MEHPAIQELQQHSAALRRLARDLVGAAAADDVLQDAALEVLRAPPREPGPLSGWLRGVVRNVAGKRRRADAVRRRHEAAAAGAVAFAVHGAEVADTLRWLTACVTTLPEPYRSTLLARYLREQSPSEIAAATGEPVRTVKTRLQRGLQLLRERFDADGRDWRSALAATFALPGPGGAAAVGITTWMLCMSMTMKLVIAAAALLVVGFGIWACGPSREQPSTSVHAAVEPVVALPMPVVAVSAPAEATKVPEPERTVVPAPAPPIVRATADQIVVHVVDAASGVPIEAFALREQMADGLGMGEKERPLRLAGSHPGGRLLVPDSFFEHHNYVVEDAAGDYLPSPWIGAADAEPREGERVIEVRLPTPREVTVRVVRERTAEAVVGTRVELLRPYPASPEVTLRTNAQPSKHFRAQTNVNEIIVKFSGGWALQLGSEVTDAEGRVRLRVNAGEQLALRVLGPGHQPFVKQPWSVAEGTGEVVETVVTGGAIEVRAIPLEALQQLRVDLPEEFGAMAARYATGVRLRNLVTGETRPAGLMPPPIPLDEQGRVRVDGLSGGDWQVSFCHSWRTGNSPRMSSDAGLVEVSLPLVQALAAGEVRILDVDVSAWSCGSLDATVTRDGKVDTAGRLVVREIPGKGGRQLRLNSLGDLLCDANGHCIARLPPARYFARLRGAAAKTDIPLGEFPIDSGATTRIDFVVDVVTMRFRVVEADGVTAARGALSLQREGQSFGGTVDAGGNVVVSALLRGDTLRAEFRIANGTTAPGQPAYGSAIELGTVRATGDDPPIVLRLPAR
ncbi:MAG TPA: sigma factor-like helix-turn-helix DNA-binding protein [Planctomycetota bacterium]|nr:sigma factor-like helix-turn-helix DNA-binding protein [Planctomycetota bacterium]